MNIVLENKFEKISRTFILLLLVSIITYSLYNILNYKSTTYYKSIEKIYIIDPVMKTSGDTVYPLTDPIIIN
jgi:hypothetical protein